MADSSKPAPASTSNDVLARLVAWSKREPTQALLAAAILGVLLYFFGFYRVFVDGAQSTAEWAWRGWNAENDLEHGPLILPAALFVVWYHRKDLFSASKASSPFGLGIVIFGVILFILSVRTLQPRIALLSIPVLGYGITRFLWGRETARIVLFPCAFLLFMIPVGFLVTRTASLQSLTAGVAAKLSSLVGVPVAADGATIDALDGSFHFQVVGGCSGIRSLTAMTMLAALYVHFTQRESWKKVAIFCSSLVFALFGNFMRIFSVVLVARFINVKIAGGLYHDYSGCIFFLTAVGAMVGCSNLLNRNWSTLVERTSTPDSPSSSVAPAALPRRTPDAGPKRATPPVSTYDY